MRPHDNDRAPGAHQLADSQRLARDGVTFSGRPGHDICVGSTAAGVRAKEVGTRNSLEISVLEPKTIQVKEHPNVADLRVLIGIVMCVVPHAGVAGVAA